MSTVLERLPLMRECARKATGIVTGLAATGGGSWRMSIPVHRDDSDLVLFETAQNVLVLADELEAAVARIRELEHAQAGAQ
jgi:hypothetical protein